MTQQFHPWAYAPGLTLGSPMWMVITGLSVVAEIWGELGAHHGERGQVKYGQCVQWGAMQQPEAGWMCT